jgi:hypothetical protein
MTDEIPTSQAYEAGRQFERHQLIQRLQVRLSELDRIIALGGSEGRCAHIAGEVRRIIDQLQNL